MKLVKKIALVVLSLLLTGCYTQLQYSQTMKKVTDSQEAPEQSWNKDQDSDYDSSEYAYDEDDYITVYYKDYQYEEKYNDCNPYNVYNFYGSNFDRYGYYGSSFSPFYSHLTISPFYFSKWRYSHRYWSGLRFGLSFSWGSPYYAYYDPFFDPFYDNFWYSRYYNSPFAYNYRYFYGYRGYAYYHGNKNWSYERKDRKYGPRSIGTNRVSRNAVRSRSRDDGNRRATVSNTNRVRSRSVGTTRTRSTVDRNRGNSSGSRVDRSRGDNGNSRSRGSSGNNRSRSRDNIQADDNQRNSSSGILRSRSYINERSLDYRQDLDDLRNRYDLQRAPKPRLSDYSQQQRRPIFFDRMRNFFKSSASQISRNLERSTSTIRNRTSSTSNRSAVSRSGNGSNKSSVTRSRSSSNNSRSRGGSSSGSRSRGGGSSSSDSDRSRGGN
jgi:hypothetical protein